MPGNQSFSCCSIMRGKCTRRPRTSNVTCGQSEDGSRREAGDAARPCRAAPRVVQKGAKGGTAASLSDDEDGPVTDRLLLAAWPGRNRRWLMRRREAMCENPDGHFAGNAEGTRAPCEAMAACLRVSLPFALVPVRLAHTKHQLLLLLSSLIVSVQLQHGTPLVPLLLLTLPER